MIVAPRPTVRRAVAADAARLAALAARCFRDTYGPDADPSTGGGSDAANVEAYVGEHLTAERQGAELADPGLVTLVTEADGALAAYAQVREPHTGLGVPAEVAASAGARPAELARLYVDPRWHGRGLGAALMAAVLDVAERMGASGVWLDVYQRNVRAIAFYGRQGFVVCGRATFRMGAEVHQDWVMARRVSGASGLPGRA